MNTAAPAMSYSSALRRGPVTLGLLGIGLLLMIALAVGIGSVWISIQDVVAILLSSIGIETSSTFSEQQELVLIHIQLPRVLLGALIGAALGVSGALMQGLFRNPLAEPGLVGVSAGSAMFAVMFIVLGSGLALPPIIQMHALSIAAFAGGLITTFVVYGLATQSGRTAVATLLLAGVALGALAGAVTGLMYFMADDVQLRTITFWTMGSLGGATWSALAGAAPLLLLGILGAPFLARSLNAMLLGEAEAFHLGIRTEYAKRITIVLVALAVGAAVAAAGVIGFVGLIVPHLARLLLGPDHRVLIPASALIGAILLLCADLIARTIVAPSELPIGIVTALAGAPFFLWLLLRERPSEHWA